MSRFALWCLLTLPVVVVGCTARESDDLDDAPEPTAVTEPQKPVVLTRQKPPSADRAARFRKLFDGLPEFRNDRSEELHAVFVGEGAKIPGKRGEHATVLVRRGSQSVVLCLFSSTRDDFTWTVKSFEESRIAAVLLAGRGEVSLEGLDDGVPVLNVFDEDFVNGHLVLLSSGYREAVIRCLACICSTRKRGDAV